MSTATRREEPGTTVLRGVPYDVYVALRRARGNDHLRMTYYDGTLEIMSPEYRHEGASSRLGLLVHLVAAALGVDYECGGGTTFRRAGAGPRKGRGKEPDASFYFTNAPALLGKEDINLDAGDPPPDLWIEVGNRASSQGKLPDYAALGVPEVWRFRVRKKHLVFLGLTPEGTYQPMERSRCLPILTPALVLEALSLGDGVLTSQWQTRLRAWIAETLQRPEERT